ncbi:MAG TPA: TonB-dependent receptor [Bacteroidota bacterium]|nr:TonB-dependent receptor [Bacteroidota bacterium]
MAQPVDIRGFVSDSLTAQRIPFANVRIVGTTRGASSNNTGFYLIPSIGPGEYDVEASVVGYSRKSVHLLVRSGKPMQLDFQLSVKPVESEGVTVTSGRRHELREINTSVHILDREDLKVVPSIAQEDVFQALKMLPGIVSTSDVSSRFYVRGGAGDQNLVLLDGMKIYNPFHALGIYSVFDPDVVQNVETYTGGFPAGYGGRLSSVVDISSRDGRSDRLSGKASLNMLSSKVLVEGPLVSGTSIIVDVRKSLFSETFKRIVNQDVPVTFYDGFSKFNAQLPGGTKIDLSYLSSSDKLRFADPLEPDYLWSCSSISGSISDLIGGRVFVQASVYSSAYTANRDRKKSLNFTSAWTSVHEPGLRAQATYYTDSQNLFFFGFDFSFPKIEYDPTGNALSIKNRYDNFTDPVTWCRYQAHFDRTQVDIGLHIELGSLLAGEQDWEAVQPRINLSYEIFGNWKLKASAGTFSQRTITISNEDDVMPIFDAWIKIPAGISPERATHLVAGVEGNISPPVSLSFQTYYKRYSSLVVYNRNKVDDSDPDYISGTGDSYGLETMIRSSFSLVELYGAYSLGWTRLDNSGFVYYPRYDRRHHINLLAAIKALTNLNVNLKWEYGSGFPYSESLGYYDRLTLDPLGQPFQNATGKPYTYMGSKNSARLPSFHRLDLGVSFQFRILGISGSLDGQIINVYDNVNVFYFDRNTGEHTDMLHFFPSATITLEY